MGGPDTTWNGLSAIIRQLSDKADSAAGTYHSLAGCMHKEEVCKWEALTQHEKD